MYTCLCPLTLVKLRFHVKSCDQYCGLRSRSIMRYFVKLLIERFVMISYKLLFIFVQKFTAVSVWHGDVAISFFYKLEINIPCCYSGSMLNSFHVVTVLFCKCECVGNFIRELWAISFHLSIVVTEEARALYTLGRFHCWTRVRCWL